jgi:zinc protease
LLVAVAVLSSPARADMVQEPPPELPVVEETFANGLHVIVAPDPNVASVVVHVRYATGAADDPLAHLVERLLFDGSVHVKAGDFDARIDAAGGWTSSTTAADHLSVFEQVPAEALELALWLEAERMAGLAVTGAALAKEQAAIAAERRAAYEDHPSGLVAREVQKQLWSGPAATDVLADVSAATLADVRRFVRARITPRDTILVIAGRVEAGHALQLAQRYFAWIPAPEHVARVDRGTLVPRTTASETTVRDAVPKVTIAFRMNAPFASDEVALEVEARLLTAPRTGRMQRALVDAKLASEVHAEIVRQRLGGELRFVATAAPGANLEQLRDLHDLMVTVIRETYRVQPADEVERAATAVEAELVANLENLAVRADSLATWATSVGSADYLGNLRAMQHVSPDALATAAKYWLAPNAAVTVIGR